MTDDRTEARRALYAEILHWMAHEIVRICTYAGADRPLKPALDVVVWHGMESSTEGLVATLWRGGVLSPIKDSDFRVLPREYKFVVTPDDIRHTASANFDDGEKFLWALTSFINRAVSFEEISAKRVPFEPSARLASIVLALANAGYVEKRGPHSFAWTNAMRPHMRLAGAWSDDDRTPEEGARELAPGVARALPAEVRSKIAACVARRDYVSAQMLISAETRFLYPEFVLEVLLGDESQR